MDNNKLQNYEMIYSVERLSSFKQHEMDTKEDIIKSYCNNIKISQALYPELCTLEVILRNAIDSTLKKQISETWIEDEINNKRLLDINEYNILLKTYNDTKNECRINKKEFTLGKVIANLNFGFWTSLCVKKYSAKIWNKPKCFYGVFANYKERPSINKIAQKLYTIRRFRNRVFHYEQIFKYPQKTLDLYNCILEILSYLPYDDLEILRQTSSFVDVYNKLIQNSAT